MKTSYTLSLFYFLFLADLSFSQNSLVKQWDYRFGGTANEDISSIQTTTDKGFILGGSSNSGINGDKTQSSWGGPDYWVIKLDSTGIKQWDKRFGGTEEDYFACLHQTRDNGYLLGGQSYSGLGGDKTEPSWGQADYWVVKIDSIGNFQWDKRLGGTDYDILTSLDQTEDGGYILGGFSNSEISGDKTETPQGGYDYWIVKIDSSGNYQWDKRFGGTADDELMAVQQTDNGGYILGGRSESEADGDKTESSWGNYDYWILKLNINGYVQWQKDFGGAKNDMFYSLQQTIDKGFILGGSSSSGMSGNKSQPSWGLSDYWALKINSLGNIEWDKDYGGFRDEVPLGSIVQTSDTGYLLSGASYSPASGDKSENNPTTSQTWIIKITSLGNKEWDKTIFTTGNDGVGYGVETYDGCYAIANYTSAGIGGYKSEPNWGASDYWLVKFCISTLPPYSHLSTTNTSICQNSCIDFIDQSVNIPYSWQWIFDGGSPSTSTVQNPLNICYNAPGIYDVTLITSNPYGSDTLTESNFITVNPPSIPVITQLSDTLISSPEYSYQWFKNGTPIIGETGQQLIIFQPAEYKVAVFDSNGCYGSDSAFFYLIPSASFESPVVAICTSSCISFFDLSTNDPSSWSWNFPGGSPASSNDQNPTDICYNATGSYDVQLIATNVVGSDTIILSDYITVYPNPPPPVIIQSNDTLICSLAATYQWSLNSNPIPGATNQQLIINTEGNYNVVITDSSGCSSISSISVTIILPESSFSSDLTNGCPGFCFDFSNSSTNANSYQWLFPGALTSSSTLENPSDICYNNPGTFNVTLITTNANGNDTLLLPSYITVYPTPLLPSITQTGYTLTSTPSTSYQWQFNSVNIAGATNQTYQVPQSGVYTVVITDDNGCSSSASLDVLISGVDEISADVNVAIYPNPSDGSFIVELFNCQIDDELKIEVRNTLGQIVFYSENIALNSYLKKTINLHDYPSGIYFLELKNDTQWIKKKLIKID